MKNLEDFLTLIDSSLHALLSEMLQQCFDIKVRNNGAINLRREKTSCQPSAEKYIIDRKTKAVILQGEDCWKQSNVVLISFVVK